MLSLRPLSNFMKKHVKEFLIFVLVVPSYSLVVSKSPQAVCTAVGHQVTVVVSMAVSLETEI